MQSTDSRTENQDKLHASMQRNKDICASAFGTYWNRVREIWQHEFNVVYFVLLGETPVTPAAIEKCRLAVLRLHQIHYVLEQRLQLSTSATKDSVDKYIIEMDKEDFSQVARDFAEVKRHFNTILGWQAAAKLSVP